MPADLTWSRANSDAGPAGRILIVEDEGIVANDLADTLRSIGYSVAAMVDTGEAAVLQARQLRPDLVVMDVRLAGEMDGVEAAEHIRKDRDVPIIYLTAHSDSETTRRAKQTEPFGYLVKPFKAPELRCAIEIAMHKHEIDARVREREQWLATMLRSIADGVIATDAARRIKFLNPAAEALTGWSNEEAVGKALDEILCLVADWSEAEAGSGVCAARASRRDAAGDDGGAPIEDHAAPIRNDEGNVLGSIMVLRDVRKRRQADEQLRRLKDELEQRVVERTAQLEAANRELESFTYSVAHDLRAPLRSIHGFSEMVIEDHAGDLGEEGVGYLQRVQSGAKQMAQLIDDLLRLAHVVKGRFSRATVDLSRVARLVSLDLRAADATREATFTIEDGLTAQGDEQLLRIALENLLGNAWKFTSKVPRAKIEFGRIASEAGRPFFVRDNGSGFDMQYANRLFVAFQRLHDPEEFGGTGIGLAMVQRIVSRHGGRIWAESTVGGGTTIYFVI